MFGRKQRTIDALRCRVFELEGRLCPDGHEWEKTVVLEYFWDGIRWDALIQHKCKKCGKTETSLRGW